MVLSPSEQQENVFVGSTQSATQGDRPMSPLGHSRPMQRVLPAGSCPLRSESDLHPALPRNDAMGHKLTSRLDAASARDSARRSRFANFLDGP
jgi:hypothetical protein